MEELLKIEGLKMYFGGLKASDGFNLTVNKGETLGIIGPNGAGKTTLFNAICGVYKPTGGKVTLEGKDITGTPAYKMAKMGFARTFQISKPLRGLTIFDNVLAAAGVHEYTGIGSYFHKSHTDDIEDKVEEIILETGLMPSDRAMVHLSLTYDDAFRAGSVRVEDPVILAVDCNKCFDEGCDIGKAARTVFLCKQVPADCLRIIHEEELE